MKPHTPLSLTCKVDETVVFFLFRKKSTKNKIIEITRNITAAVK
ncbi:hypothetical protein [Spiroplasma litorale]|nr:hypothetical protein [Spiroplasma litorale]